MEQRRAEAMALAVLPVAHHARIVRPDGLERVCVSVDPADELVSLWTPPPELDAMRSATPQQGSATFPDAEPPHPVPVIARVQHADYEYDVRIPILPVEYPAVQPMPGGGVLVVGTRCRWRTSGPDLNAIRFDADGRRTHAATFGDGIEHVYATPSGHIWVGYFDEGMYGNYGWGRGAAPTPIGACGLVRFGADLRQSWRFPAYDAISWEPISDCYALNVDGETAWLCYYTDFPIVRVQDGRLTHWSNEDIAGAKAVAVFGEQVALCGGYRPDRDRIALGHLGDGAFHLTAEYRLVLPDGSPLPDGTRIECRGMNIHVITGDDWYQLSLADLPRHHRS